MFDQRIVQIRTLFNDTKGRPLLVVKHEEGHYGLAIKWPNEPTPDHLAIIAFHGYEVISFECGGGGRGMSKHFPDLPAAFEEQQRLNFAEMWDDKAAVELIYTTLPRQQQLHHLFTSTGEDRERYYFFREVGGHYDLAMVVESTCDDDAWRYRCLDGNGESLCAKQTSMIRALEAGVNELKKAVFA